MRQEKKLTSYVPEASSILLEVLSCQGLFTSDEGNGCREESWLFIEAFSFMKAALLWKLRVFMPGNGAVLSLPGPFLSYLAKITKAAMVSMATIFLALFQLRICCLKHWPFTPSPFSPSHCVLWIGPWWQTFTHCHCWFSLFLLSASLSLLVCLVVMLWSVLHHQMLYV